MNPLSPRQQAILTRIVDAHVETAQPVGSKFITSLYTEIYGDSYSSATVRNEMGSLEEKGYLQHPHTSAGRIPTDLGYRYYVDHNLRSETIHEDEVRTMNRELEQSVGEFESFAEKVSEILSRRSEAVSLVVISGQRRRKLFLQGTSRMLEKPEFQDLGRVKKLLEILEEKAGLIEWLSREEDRAGISVTIGRENQNHALQDCAVVSSHYRFRGGFGTLAVMGPCRMRYGRMLPLVAKMSRLVERILGQAEEEIR